MDRNGTANSTTTTCSPFIDKNSFFLYSLGAAVGIITLLSFLEKRKSRHCKPCGARPEILVPANLLDGRTDPFSFAAAFGCTASTCLSLILYEGNPANLKTESYNDWLRVFIWMFTVLEIGVLYYPFFACLSSKCRLVSSIVGFCYSIIWFLIQLDNVIECLPPPLLFKGENVVVQLPVLVCLLFLVVKFGHNFVIEIYPFFIQKRNPIEYTSFEKQSELSEQIKSKKHDGLAQECQLRYVRSLLHKPSDNLSFEESFGVSYIQNAAISQCRPSPTFRYSPKIIATFVVAVVCVYEWGFKFLLQFASLLQFANILLNKVEKNTTIFVQGRLFIQASEVSGIVAFILSTLIISFHVFNIFRNYRDHLQRLYKGDYSKLPRKMLHISASETMTYSLHYAGIQIAVLLLGYSVLVLVIYVMGLLLAYFLVFPFMDLVPSEFLQPFYAIVPISLITMAFFYIQKYICHKVLLDQTKVIKKVDNGYKSYQVLAVDNRKTYHNFSYFLFFLYIILGAYKSFERITKGIFLGTFFLARMDRSALMQGFENMDSGYMAYICFLKMELTHCHPVLVTFCHIIKKLKEEKEIGNMSSVEIPTPTSSASVEIPTPSSSASNGATGSFQSQLSIGTYDRQIRNRWLKCYTLVRNPCLVHLCKRCISQKNLV